MESNMSIRKLIVVALVLCITSESLMAVSARYLPTKRQGQDDRMDRLREILRELFESEFEQPSRFEGPPHRVGQALELENSPAGHAIYKREARPLAPFNF